MSLTTSFYQRFYSEASGAVRKRDQAVNAVMGDAAARGFTIMPGGAIAAIQAAYEGTKYGLAELNHKVFADLSDEEYNEATAGLNATFEAAKLVIEGRRDDISRQKTDADVAIIMAGIELDDDKSVLYTLGRTLDNLQASGQIAVMGAQITNRESISVNEYNSKISSINIDDSVNREQSYYDLTTGLAETSFQKQLALTTTANSYSLKQLQLSVMETLEYMKADKTKTEQSTKIDMDYTIQGLRLTFEEWYAENSSEFEYQNFKIKQDGDRDIQLLNIEFGYSYGLMEAEYQDAAKRGETYSHVNLAKAEVDGQISIEEVRMEGQIQIEKAQLDVKQVEAQLQIDLESEMQIIELEQNNYLDLAKMEIDKFSQESSLRLNGDMAMANLDSQYSQSIQTHTETIKSQGRMIANELEFRQDEVDSDFEYQYLQSMSSSKIKIVEYRYGMIRDAKTQEVESLIRQGKMIAMEAESAAIAEIDMITRTASIAITSV